MKLSIIIPVYDVEPFVRGTLDSIYKQGVDENLFEVIVVNDGTPDNSMDIVVEFADTHPNLVIINQENQGLSAARNAGMKVAKSDYIWTVDSDDSITENSISQALEEIDHHPDVEMFCFDLREQRVSYIKMTTLFTKSAYSKFYGEMHDGFFYCRKLPTGISPRFLFRRSFLEKYGLEFTLGIYHEDQDFLIRCYTKAKRILPLKRIWYNYNIRESGSITSTFKMKRFYDTLWIVKNFRNLSESSSDKKEITILEEGVFSLSYELLTSSYHSHPEYRAFLDANKKELKSLLWYSYFRSIRKNSLGKTYRMIKSICL